jgi:hypothetical protein
MYALSGRANASLAADRAVVHGNTYIHILACRPNDWIEAAGIVNQAAPWAR